MTTSETIAIAAAAVRLYAEGNELSGLTRVSAGRGEFLGSGELLPVRSPCSRSD